MWTHSARVTHSLATSASCLSSAAAVKASLRRRPPPTAPRPSAKYSRGSANVGRIGLLDLIERQRPARHAMRELFEGAGSLADAALRGTRSNGAARDSGR